MLEIVIKNYNNLPDLGSFENIFNEEKQKENPDFNKFYEYVIKIDDFILRSEFIYQISNYFKNSKPDFKDFYVQKEKNKNFSFTDNIKIKGQRY
jgi:hypothetical protein